MLKKNIIHKHTSHTYTLRGLHTVYDIANYNNNSNCTITTVYIHNIITHIDTNYYKTVLYLFYNSETYLTSLTKYTASLLYKYIFCNLC